MNCVDSVTIGPPGYDTGVLRERTLAARSADVITELWPVFSIGALQDVAGFALGVVLPLKCDLRRSLGNHTQFRRRIF